MARVTVEDCMMRVPNRYSLVHIVAKRVRQMREGAEYLVHSPKNEDIVIALREVAAGKVRVEQEEPEDIDEIRSACLNRHNEAVNVLFFDFSVRRTGLKELWLLWWHRDWPIPTAWPLPIWPAWMEHMKDPY